MYASRSFNETTSRRINKIQNFGTLLLCQARSLPLLDLTYSWIVAVFESQERHLPPTLAMTRKGISFELAL